MSETTYCIHECDAERLAMTGALLMLDQLRRDGHISSEVKSKYDTFHYTMDAEPPSMCYVIALRKLGFSSVPSVHLRPREGAVSLTDRNLREALALHVSASESTRPDEL